MWRWLALGAALYGLGHPGFEAYRPSAFERSLREFHRDVNRVATNLARPFGLPDQARTLQQLNPLSAKFQTMLSAR